MLKAPLRATITTVRHREGHGVVCFGLDNTNRYIVDMIDAD